MNVVERYVVQTVTYVTPAMLDVTGCNVLHVRQADTPIGTILVLLVLFTEQNKRNNRYTRQ